jgi:hypothetical protein
LTIKDLQNPGWKVVFSEKNTFLDEIKETDLFLISVLGGTITGKT